MNKHNYPPLSNVMDLLLDAVCVVDVEGRFVFVSAACERIFGYPPEEMLGKAMIELIHPDDIAKTLDAAREIMAGHPKLHFENRYRHKNGRVVHIMWSAQWSETDQVRIAVARDITERKRAETLQAALYAISEAAHAAEDLAALFQQAHRIIGELLPAPNFYVALYDADTDQLSFPYHVDEQAQSSAPARSAADLCGQVVRSGLPLLLAPELPANSADTSPETDDRELFSWLAVPLSSHNGTQGALLLKSASATLRYTEQDQELLQFVATQVATAVERTQLYTRLQYMAQYDDLTGLPNRSFLYDRLECALTRARRTEGRLSVLYLDLDSFKQVNDSLGHAAGDLLLQEVATRLKRCVRESDTVARTGGDEFVVMLEGTELPEYALVVAEKIRTALREPMHIEGRSLRTLTSIGIAHYPRDGDQVAELLKHADEAMYAAKPSGKQG